MSWIVAALQTGPNARGAGSENVERVEEAEKAVL